MTSFRTPVAVPPFAQSADRLQVPPPDSVTSHLDLLFPASVLMYISQAQETYTASFYAINYNQETVYLFLIAAIQQHLVSDIRRTPLILKNKVWIF